MDSGQDNAGMTMTEIDSSLSFPKCFVGRSMEATYKRMQDAYYPESSFSLYLPDEANKKTRRSQAAAHMWIFQRSLDKI